MNFDEKIDPPRVRRALTTLKQKIEEISEIAPGVDFYKLASLEELPEEGAENLEYHLQSIYAYGEYYGQKVMSELSDQVLNYCYKEDRELLEYYRDNYEPTIEKIKKLIVTSYVPTRKWVEIAIAILHKGAIQSDIDKSMDIYEDCAVNGWVQDYIFKRVKEMYEQGLGLHDEPDNTLYSLNQVIEAAKTFKQCFLDSVDVRPSYYKVMKEDDDIYDDHELDYSLWCLEEEIEGHIDVCKKLEEQPYFSPDEWTKNKKDVLPIPIDLKKKKLPRRIESRIMEINKSYIFGNWMAVIALSRCLLEYAIIDVADSHKIDIYQYIENKKSTKLLKDLILETKKIFPELEKSMEYIRKHGNKVLHPPSTKNPLYDILSFSQKEAKCSFRHINKIISRLYRTPN